MERLFGLPAHPLVVHFPVVAIPLLAIAIFALAWRPAWLDTIGVGVAVFAIATSLTTFLAARSGEALVELLNSGDGIDTHRTLGEQLKIIVAVQASAAVILVINNVTRFLDEEHPVHRVLVGIGVVSSVVALVWVVRTGHSGAEQSWGFLS